MCYSAQLEQDLKALKKLVKAKVDLASFKRLFQHRLEDDSIKVPKALEANFYTHETAEEAEITALIETYRTRRIRALEPELFVQKKRLDDAERALRLKETKTARLEQQRAENKVQRILGWLSDLKRAELKEKDSRIYPFYYAPVVVQIGGEAVIRPMRYHCRPAGKPESYDRRYDGLYNARRDNLQGFWKGQFGKTHAYTVMTGFYENVARHDFEHRDLAPGEKSENLILHFNPKPAFQMRVACLWSAWGDAQDPVLESFAAVTDEPPPEVAATGHNRCVIPLAEQGLRTWMDPTSHQPADLLAALDDRERPYYEHRMAA